MRKEKNLRTRVVTGVQYSIIILWVAITLVVFGWVFLSSFKANSEIFINIWGLPSKWMAVNYKNAWTHGHMDT